MVNQKDNGINLDIRRICVFYLQSTVFKHIMSKNHTDDCCIFQYKGTYISIYIIWTTRTYIYIFV